MKKYIYHVSVLNQQSDCPTMKDVVTFANSVIGCDLLSKDMVYNYFSTSRPDKVNKQILGRLIQLSRKEVIKKSASSAQE
eukprot:COSAG05_NODE_3226_length_2224_cov_12.832471_2_plen_80_part_00